MGAKSRLWRQIVTDVIGFNQDYVAKNPGAPLGGRVPSWNRNWTDWEMINERVKVTDTSKPDPVNHDRYVKMFGIYRSTCEHLKQDFTDLIAILRRS